MNEQNNEPSIKTHWSRDLAALRHLALPLSIKAGVFLYPERHVDRLAPIGALMAEPIEIRPTRFTATCHVSAQISVGQTEHFAMQLSWDDKRHAVAGGGVNKNGNAIEVELSEVNVDMSINAPAGIAIASDRHLMSGLIEKSMEAKIDATQQLLTREFAYSKAVLSALSIDELLRRYAMLEELHCYAKRRIHHWRIDPETLTKSELARSQAFKSLADQLNAQLSLLKSELARLIQPDFVELYRFHQLARQTLPRDTFKSLNDLAKGKAFAE